ncbi:class I SAM-dependent methyltransferase [Nocardioides sp.]|uniref:class I SAM-dependent methyltransferase n=1 Tax=Nocardioides sp. TaxID=35761 RepID=UPI002B26D395|nr:class I SAM-dependent methyltransferase [Nocardioides sp.]
MTADGTLSPGPITGENPLPGSLVERDLDVPFSTIFARALQGEPCAVVGLDDEPRVLPMSEWTREADTHDHALLDLCEGATLDIGCGPGRLTAALASRSQVALGIDVVHEAVGQTRERGGSALRRDIYDELPGEGRWHTALLADGNVGIGGDPVALLRRVREVIDPRGRIVIEVEAPGVAHRTVWASLETDTSRSRPFRWSVVGLDDIEDIALQAGLEITHTRALGARRIVVLQERR